MSESVAKYLTEHFEFQKHTTLKLPYAGVSPQLGIAEQEVTSYQLVRPGSTPKLPVRRGSQPPESPLPPSMVVSEERQEGGQVGAGEAAPAAVTHGSHVSVARSLIQKSR